MKNLSNFLSWEISFVSLCVSFDNTNIMIHFLKTQVKKKKNKFISLLFLENEIVIYNRKLNQ